MLKLQTCAYFYLIASLLEIYPSHIYSYISEITYIQSISNHSIFFFTMTKDLKPFKCLSVGAWLDK